MHPPIATSTTRNTTRNPIVRNKSHRRSRSRPSSCSLPNRKKTSRMTTCWSGAYSQCTLVDGFLFVNCRWGKLRLEKATESEFPKSMTTATATVEYKTRTLQKSLRRTSSSAQSSGESFSLFLSKSKWTCIARKLIRKNAPKAAGAGAATCGQRGHLVKLAQGVIETAGTHLHQKVSP